MKLWLIRHPRPLVDRGVCYGQTDVLVNPTVVAATASALAPALPVGIPIYTSPLIRARELAEAIHQRRPDLILREDERLKEIDFGEWEQQRWDDIPKQIIDRWVNDFATYRFGGVESAADVVLRVSEFLHEVARNEQLAIVTHAGVINAIRWIKQSGSAELATISAPEWPSDSLPFGQCQSLELDRFGVPLAAADQPRATEA